VNESSIKLVLARYHRGTEQQNAGRSWTLRLRALNEGFLRVEKLTTNSFVEKDSQGRFRRKIKSVSCKSPITVFYYASVM
jgi:hypothetical protein